MLLRVLIARLSDRGQLLELRKPRVEHAEALKLPRSAKLRGQPLRHGGSVIGAVPVDVGVRNEIACRRLIRYTMCQSLLALMNTSCSTTCNNANNNEWQSVINRRAAKSAIGGSDEEAACGKARAIFQPRDVSTTAAAPSVPTSLASNMPVIVTRELSFVSKT